MISDIQQAIEKLRKRIDKICNYTVYHQGDTIRRMNKICNLLAQKSEVVIYGMQLDVLISKEKSRNRGIIIDYYNHKRIDTIAMENKLGRRQTFRIIQKFREKNETILKKLKKLCENACVFENNLL